MTRIVAAAALALASAGCLIVHDRPYRHTTIVDYETAPPSPSGSLVVIDRGHVHSASCGHYWYNGGWYAHRGHVHGPGCGHVHHDGVWVLAGNVAIKAGHVHSAHCGHYQHGGVWYYMHNHVHGPGCGHVHRGGAWVAVKF